MTFRLIPVLALGMALSATSLYGQQEVRSPISTGRPSFASGAGVVPSFQVEAGYEFSDAGASERHTLGQLTLRLPLLPMLEVRAAVGSFAVQRVSGTTTTGFDDLVVGTKVRVATGEDDRPLVPSVALIASSSLPTATDGFGSERLQPAANLILAWPLGTRAELLSNTAARARFAGGEHFRELAQGVFLGLDLPGPLGSFVEVYGTSPERGDFSSSVGFGLTYLLHRDLQLDLHGGVGLNAAAQDYYAGIGIGWRR